MNRIYLLDFARGIAAISVAIFHYKLFYSYNINTEKYIIENQPFFEYIKLIYQTGWIAVQFFFLLSGFIFFKLYLHKIYKKKINFYNFLILRISRFYPLHLIILIFIFLICLTLNNFDFTT
jgi:peptidoglycan/LPS O-acetylase OafA/YrhL